MKKLFSLFSVIALALTLCTVAEARGIQEHCKLALAGVNSPIPGGPAIALASNGQAMTGINISTQAGYGQFTALFDTNLVYEETIATCFFDVYTPPATTQFFDFTGIGTLLNGSTQGIAGPQAYIQPGTTGVTVPQVKSSSGVLLVALHTDASVTNPAVVTVYVDASAD